MLHANANLINIAGVTVCNGLNGAELMDNPWAKRSFKAVAEFHAATDRFAGKAQL